MEDILLLLNTLQHQAKIPSSDQLHTICAIVSGIVEGTYDEDVLTKQAVLLLPELR